MGQPLGSNSKPIELVPESYVLRLIVSEILAVECHLWRLYRQVFLNFFDIKISKPVGNSLRFIYLMVKKN